MAEGIIDSGILNTQYRDHYVSSNVAHCCIVKSLPSPDDWKNAYAKDLDTNYLISRLTKDKSPWVEHEVKQVNQSNRSHLRENRIILKNNCLLIFHPVTKSNCFLTLIIVPQSLRHTVFLGISCI